VSERREGTKADAERAGGGLTELHDFLAEVLATGLARMKEVARRRSAPSEMGRRAKQN